MADGHKVLLSTGPDEEPKRVSAIACEALSTGEPQWRLLEEFGAEARERVVRVISELLAKNPDTCLDHEPEWLTETARSNGGEVKLYLCTGGDGRLMGYAPFLVHPTALSFSYGSWTPYEYRIRRFSLTGQPLLVEDGASADYLVTSLLARVRRDLVGRDVLFGYGVRLDSAFGRAVSSAATRRLFHVLPHGPIYRRRLLRLPGNVDEYMGLLGTKTRQELRRQERRLMKETGGDVRVSVYSGAGSVGGFLDAVGKVSDRTWQWKQMRAGVRDNERTRQHFENVAAHGWLRGYVLHCRGTPAAFMVGYLYRSVYYSETIGYDPAWGEWSIGNMLHVHVVRDLTENRVGAQWFDFLGTDNPNKERLSTEWRAEGNFYFVPRTVRWAALVWAFRAFDKGTREVNALLERAGIKSRVKRFLRRRAAG